MNRVISYLDCGCAITADGRTWKCPSCLSPPADPSERTYTRDEVLRIATAAATMHHNYPRKGWDAADAALMAIAWRSGEAVWHREYDALMEQMLEADRQLARLRERVAELEADVERLATDREEIGDRYAKSLADARSAPVADHE